MAGAKNFYVNGDKLSSIYYRSLCFNYRTCYRSFHLFCFYNALGIYPSRRWSCGVLSPLPWIRPRVPAAALWYERSYLYISSCCGGVVRNDRRNCHLRCNHFRIGHICLQICLRLALAPDLSLPSKQTLLNEFHCFTRN